VIKWLGKKMHYTDYQNSRDAAWRIIIQENIAILPVQISEDGCGSVAINRAITVIVVC
jgi:hypothetical protein